MPTAAPSQRVRGTRRLLPGLGLVALAVAAGFALMAAVPAINAVIGAMAGGVIAGPYARRRPAVDAGVQWAGRTLLRAGVALLGLRISVADAGTLGVGGIVLAVGTVVVTYAAVLWLGERLGVGRDLTRLVAAGSAICGAAAIAAMRDVTRARDHEVAQAVAAITVFGTLAMLGIPALGTGPLGLGEHRTALWVGASIHEVAQVTGAGATLSIAALEAATLVKLARVLLLAPLIAVTGRKAHITARPIVPGFVLAFLALVFLRSAVALPEALVEAALGVSMGLLAAGLAALGLQLRPAELAATGPRPLALGFAASLIVGGSGLVLVLVLGP